MREESLEFIMMSRTQDLALKCLREKWYGISDYSDHEDWIEDCAFCEDAKNLAEEDEYTDRGSQCGYCLIEHLPICKAIAEIQDSKDPSLIVEALEEIVKFGDLSSETHDKLVVFV